MWGAYTELWDFIPVAQVEESANVFSGLNPLNKIQQKILFFNYKIPVSLLYLFRYSTGVNPVIFLNTVLKALVSGRKVTINFNSEDTTTKITETFEAEEINTVELQKGGWQAILDSFKKYTESK